jgi:hypothetical protein
MQLQAWVLSSEFRRFLNFNGSSSVVVWKLLSYVAELAIKTDLVRRLQQLFFATLDNSG